MLCRMMYCWSCVSECLYFAAVGRCSSHWLVQSLSPDVDDAIFELLEGRRPHMDGLTVKLVLRLLKAGIFEVGGLKTRPSKSPVSP